MKLAEMMLDLNQPERNPAEVVRYGGFEFHRQRSYQPLGNLWFIFKSGGVVGAFQTEYRGSDRMSIHVEIESEYQRKGIGTVVYQFADQLAKQADRKLVPGHIQTDASKAFWRKHRSTLNI